MNAPASGAPLYDQAYAEVALPEHDWLINRSAIAALIQRELRLAPTDRVLDVGANDGYVMRTLRPLVAQADGIDVNVDAVASAADAHVQVMDARHLAFADGAFTKIYSSHTIEHIPDLAAVFHEMARVLTPGGEVLLIYPWELFRGMAAMRSSMKLTGNPFRAREFHVHKLDPRRLRPFWQGAPFREHGSRLVFLRTPQWVTHLVRL